jgi:hypothetical protein
MNDFMRIDEPEVHDSIKPPSVNQGSIDGFNFLVEQRKHFTMIPKPVCYKVRLAICEFAGRTPGQLASI